MEMEDLKFPRTINMFEWTKYLNRELTNEEQCLFHSVKTEKMMNIQLEKINQIIKNKGLEISNLSVLDGNCLFDSLSSLGLANNSDELRKGLTYLLILYQDYSNFFPDQKESIKELFNSFNEVEFVHCKQDSKIYKYTFDVMCQDMFESCNWTRLNTELILMFLSKLFNINITIIQDSGFEHNIFLGDNTATTIYLAHVAEAHYLPIDKIVDDKQKYVEYDICKKTFLSWAVKQAYEKHQREKQLELSKNNVYSEIDIDEESLKKMLEK